MLYLRGGRGGECNDGCRAYLVDYRAYPSVFGSEVVPPLGDAVRFVNGVERYCDVAQELYVFGFCEGFGRHVQQFCPAGRDVFLDGLDCRSRQ